MAQEQNGENIFSKAEAFLQNRISSDQFKQFFCKNIPKALQKELTNFTKLYNKLSYNFLTDLTESSGGEDIESWIQNNIGSNHSMVELYMICGAIEQTVLSPLSSTLQKKEVDTKSNPPSKQTQKPECKSKPAAVNLSISSSPSATSQQTLFPPPVD